MAGSAAEAAQVVSAGLRRFVRGPSGVVLVAAAQIPGSWLPALPGFRFDRLSDEVWWQKFDQCEAVTFVRLERIDAMLTVTIAQGMAGRYREESYEFIRQGGTWRATNAGGLPATRAGRTAHSPCQ